MAIRTINNIIGIFLLTSLLLAGCAGSSLKTDDTKASARALEDMGIALVRQGNPREGLAYLLKAEEIDPNNPDIEYQLAIVYQDIEAYDLALQHFKKAIRLKLDFSDAINDM